MKKVLTIATAALLALPVLADDAKKKSTTTTQATTTTAAPAATGTVLDPQPVQVNSGDSALVAAAKRANRKGKKPANVITNETVKKSGKNAHITTTASQKPLPPAPVINLPSEQEMRQQKADKERLDAFKKAEEDKKQKEKEAALRRLAAAAAAAENDLADPDASVHSAEEARKAVEKQEKKPPQE